MIGAARVRSEQQALREGTPVSRSTLAAVAFVVLAAMPSVADDADECERYRLYGLMPGMTSREVRDQMAERGKIGPDKKSIDYYRTTSAVHLEFDDAVNRKTATLVLVRSHIPTSVDSAPVLESLGQRLGEPTAGKDSLDGGLEDGPATWIDGGCGVVVEISRQGEHLWDPSRAGIYIESRIMLPAVVPASVAGAESEAAATPQPSPEESVLDDLLVGTAVVLAASDEAPADTDTTPTDEAAPVAETGSTPREPPVAQPITGGESSSGSEVAVAGLGGVTYPERLQRYYVKPVYPFAAKQAKMSGVVHVRVVVQEDGTVGEASIVRSSPPGVGFEDSALDAVKRWRFKPALREGDPVAASILVKVDFL